jgi:hypothetical protein
LPSLLLFLTPFTLFFVVRIEGKIGRNDMSISSFETLDAVGAVHQESRPFVIDHFVHVVHVVALGAFNIKFFGHLLPPCPNPALEN